MRGEYNTIPTRKRERERLKRRFPGFQSAVSKRLGRQRGQVSRVWNLKETSAPVKQALLAELNMRISAEGGGVAAPARMRSAGTILLAEDIREVRELVRQSLEKAGYTVLAARSGAEALRISKRHEQPIHLLLTDVVMPGMSGLQLARRLAARRKDLKILYMTAYPNALLLADGFSQTDLSFLVKPFTPRELLLKVSERLAAPKSRSWKKRISEGQDAPFHVS